MICPFLDNNELCSIYDERFDCCKNFPNRNNKKCIDAWRCDDDCKNCVDKCCKHITLTNNDISFSLNCKCDDCIQTW